MIINITCKLCMVREIIDKLTEDSGILAVKLHVASGEGGVHKINWQALLF